MSQGRKSHDGMSGEPTSGAPQLTTDVTSPVGRTAGAARVRVIALISVVALLVTAGVVAGISYAINRLDRAIPQTDLFGSSTPTPDASGDLSPEPGPTTPPPGSDITGPLNFLLAGHDMVPGNPDRLAPHSDAVMILHVDASLTQAYLTSLPRDLLVNVPANEASGTGADYTKLTHAMTYGSRVPGSSERDLAQGFALLARTVSAYTGIDHFDGGAVLSFSGLARLVDALGGIDVYVDTPVTSKHMGPDGTSAEERGGPFQHYPVGVQHMEGWQALDYCRQRYSLSDGAYGRDRHIRQVVKAMITKLVSFDLLRYPQTAPFVIAALGDSITLDLRGRQLHEYVYALRNLRPEAITLVGLPGGSVFSGGSYLGESLAPIQAEYFAAVRNDTVGEFLARNPGLVNRDAPV
ncbi:MAG: LCP family protein [Micromonosporaceae bacterium]|nr:LCP family protein [Micromonosporaceae bacterium]